MKDLLADLVYEFRRYKDLADRAMVHLDDQDFFRRPADHVNPVAVMVKHLAGNLLSRWTDFLTSDGEKASRDRDAEARERHRTYWEGRREAARTWLAKAPEVPVPEVPAPEMPGPNPEVPPPPPMPPD